MGQVETFEVPETGFYQVRYKTWDMPKRRFLTAGEVLYCLYIKSVCLVERWRKNENRKD